MGANVLMAYEISTGASYNAKTLFTSKMNVHPRGRSAMIIPCQYPCDKNVKHQIL